MSDQSTDILIVGAGVAGAATAYHLKRLSRRNVLIVDKEATPGVHSSGRNASFIREMVPEETLQPVLSEGAAFLRRAELADYHRCGLLLLGSGKQNARDMVPVARGKGTWYPQDGVVDVSTLLQNYLADQHLQCNTAVSDWVNDGDGLVVHTDHGEIHCRIVVNAAGPWAGQLGNLPLTPMNRHLFATPPLDWVNPNWPFVWDEAHEVYFRPESGGLLLSCCDETPAAPGEYIIENERLDELAEKLAATQPDLGELSIQNTWVGQRVFAPDRRFVVGFDPVDQRVFHVAALGGHGITSSYAVGRIAAELILKSPSAEANPFDPGRFQE